VGRYKTVIFNFAEAQISITHMLEFLYVEVNHLLGKGLNFPPSIKNSIEFPSPCVSVPSKTLMWLWQMLPKLYLCTWFVQNFEP
jgi:hypothetical protein